MSPTVVRPGTVIGQFLIQRELGRGAMATVYLADDTRNGRPVAVKVFRPEIALVLGPERFLREIRIAATISHPNVLGLFDSGEFEGTLYYVMPFLADGTLRQRLRNGGPLSIDTARSIGAGIADALAVTHARGIVHRDIKPENILLEGDQPRVADFGIARLLGATGDVNISSSGLAMGTPAYMSPEQASATGQIDGRSDLYSLGCVLFEMLAGEPPFHGPTPVAVSRRHLNEAVPSLRIVRPEVPAWLEQVVERALSKTPADRFQNADELGAALRTGSPVSRAVAKRIRGIAAVAALLLALTVGFFLWRTSRPTDPELVALLPFHREGPDSGASLSGDGVARQMQTALGRWRDLRFVTVDRVRELVAPIGRLELLQKAAAVARRAGAGRFIWGEISRQGDSVLIRASLSTSARRPVVISEAQALVEGGGRVAESVVADMATGLFLGPRAAAAALAAGRATESLSAARDYLSADSALSIGDIGAARRLLARSLRADPSFPQANLWVAQVASWVDEPRDQWAALARAAASRMERLTPGDRLLADALVAQVAGDYRQACASYAARLAPDTLDAKSWLGLADCLARDQAVQPDRRSPSGWSFRSSYQAALAGYIRALELGPLGYGVYRGRGFERLLQITYGDDGGLREGYHLGRDTVWFAAFPALAGDSLAFVPFPRDQVVTGRVIPATIELASARSRNLIESLAQQWVRQFPDSSDVRLLLAELVERKGGLNLAQPERDSAMTLLQQASERARDSLLGVRIVVAQVRVRLKLGQFAAARATADSILKGWPNPPPAVADYLGPLATLVGRPARAVDLANRSSAPDHFYTAASEPVQVPKGVGQPALAMLVYSAIGADQSVLDSLERQVRDAVGGMIPPTDQARVLEAVLDDASIYAFPRVGLRRNHREQSGARDVLGLQWRAAHRRFAEVKAELGRLARLRSLVAPGKTSIELVFQEAELLAGLGDSVGSRRRLDAALDALPASRTDQLGTVSKPAALVRAMALRADLARASGERSVAAKWAQAVAALWSGGEPIVEPVLTRMKSITR